MATLDEDLQKYWDETYHKGDVKAGFKLLGEIAGIVTVGGFLVSALFVWIPGVGIPISAAVAIRILAHAASAYATLSTEERKQVRSVVRWLNGGIRFLD